MKLIKLHKEWVEKEELPKNGLCESTPKKYAAALDLFQPMGEDSQEIEKNKMSILYWASDLHFKDKNRQKSYTPLRQTIVLLICAMRNEI